MMLWGYAAREACPIAALAMTNPLMSALGLNACLQCDWSATNRLSTGTALKCIKISLYCVQTYELVWSFHKFTISIYSLMAFIHIQRHCKCFLQFKITCLHTEKWENTQHQSVECTSFVKIYVTKRLILPHMLFTYFLSNIGKSKNSRLNYWNIPINTIFAISPFSVRIRLLLSYILEAFCTLKLSRDKIQWVRIYKFRLRNLLQ